ncbi:2-amino-4-hydroxy-6-hydroxymethyldihydropteridine diphosphokinase [Algoriphagus limi]|uniref:2-amino-4-hydroxy-6-hydroxymethyldihydropteridine pyrophosphokinase n=1 Tax=Algoriphagus limi TaxID=2975273 RepID=A0ABT2GB95_9BACT|nr:2-amino-4-hydroxy-6-hydroxymethyldihydropteridine diphosphokinase [Algoriphagus limi]MCS5491691.1 2-amino-4-hydroxy-6-hydroxymethyldihydropteridine diphosphokinase [Algoriphagus limi]
MKINLKAKMVHEVVLILGGNQGDRKKLLDNAKAAIGRLGKLVKESRIFTTEAWGGVAKEAFLNQALILETELGPLRFLKHLQQIEKNMGRKRQIRWGDRTMDIDILFWDDVVIDLPELKIPHPEMANRRFVLEPLMDIVPELVHPVFGKTIHQLLEECPDTSKVSIFPESA